MTISHERTSLIPKKVSFPAKDGLRITADLYRVKNPVGFVLLCHRSHFNRGEYREIAPKLNTLGFSCMAIDQRSGMRVLGYENETYARAKKKGLSTGYGDARQDIEAAVEYFHSLSNKKPIILFGSSYSASLALLIATDNGNIRAVVAFSPGEYLKNIRVAESIKELKKPTYVTSAKKEAHDVSKVIQFVRKKYVTRFTPNAVGAHGARALWETTPGHERYWESLTRFLNQVS